MSRRTERVGAEIRRELGAILLHEMVDPRLDGMPSVTRVKVAEDLSTADVFVTVMGTDGKQSAALNALKHSAGHLRSRLTKSMVIRQVPLLKFHLDEALRKELEVLDLLEKVRQENEALDRKRAALEESATEPSGDPAAALDAHLDAQPEVREVPPDEPNPTAPDGAA